MERYKRSGLKLTPQRLAILKFLEGNVEHPSVEQIYKGVVKKVPTISLATVYNTLETLKQHRQVKELNIDPLKKRFDPNTEAHHHVLCIGCQKILDVHGEFFIHPPKIESEEFEIIGSQIEFYGFCSKCKNKKET